jgi:hypothetical protein
MNNKVLATFVIFLFALALTSSAYPYWEDTINMRSKIETAHLNICIKDHNTTQAWQMSSDNHTLELTGSIIPGQTIWTGIIIKNNGSTPATITFSIVATDTGAEKWFSNQTYFYGPYKETDSISTVWDKATTKPPSGGSQVPPELSAKDRLVSWQNITLDSACPSNAFTAIKITVAYTATFSTWTDTVYVIYTLAYSP